jgi:hypothetical protein
MEGGKTHQVMCTVCSGPQPGLHWGSAELCALSCSALLGGMTLPPPPLWGRLCRLPHCALLLWTAPITASWYPVVLLSSAVQVPQCVLATAAFLVLAWRVLSTR